MSAPTSLARQTGQATPATTRQAKPSPTPYEPSPDALVRGLPTTVRYSGKVWWNEWIGDPFISKKRVAGGGAKGWVRREFIGNWWSDNMPGVDISDKDKIWYFDGTKVGTQIYTYLNNSSVRGTSGRDPNGPGATKEEPVVKFRQFGQDYWRRANRDQYDAAVEEWIRQHNGEEPNFGHLRKISFDTFKLLPQEEQDRWDAIAKEALQASQAGAKLSNSSERAKYYEKFDKELDTLLKQADTKANVKLIGVVVHERPDGTLKIDRKFSNALQSFSNNPAVANLLQVFAEWVEQTDGEPVEGCAPTATVYPNYAKENYPMIPNYVGWTLEPLQGLVRGYVRGVFAFQGACCRVMWTEIKADPLKFIDPKRIPPTLLENWDDPSKFLLNITVLWVDFILACQKGEVPDDRRFQFTLVPAGTNPIHPSDSQEDSRVQVERDGRLMWMLAFTRTVTKCHQSNGLKGMGYSKGAIAFADFMATGKIHAHSISAPPRSWLDLPSANSSIPDFVIGSAEKEYWLSLAVLLPDSQKDRVILLIDWTNKHQYHLPATDLKGIYKSKKLPPVLVPSSPQPTAVPHTMYLPHCYFQRSPPPNGTVGYYEEWFEEIIDEKFLIHEASGTLFGGDTGVVCLTRSLIQLLFNFSAVRGDFTPPEDPPANHDRSRLPLHDWSRLLGWTDTLLDLINRSTETLSQTSHERRGDLGRLQPLPADNSPPAEDLPRANEEPQSNPEPVPSGSYALTRSSSNPKPRKKRTHTKSKKNGRKHVDRPSDDEVSEQSPDSESESEAENQDYDLLDRTSQDDEDDNSWLNGDNSFSTMAPGIASPVPTCEMEGGSDFDRLQLRCRYGFTGVDTVFELREEDDQPSNVWVSTTGVFGKFRDLPPYEPLHFHTPNALIKHIKNITRSCQEAMADFDQYLELNPRVFPRIVKNARAQAQDYPKHQLLYEYIFLRRGIWDNAARIALHGVFAHGTHLALIVRESAQAQLMAHNTIKHGVFPDPDIGPVELGQAVRSLNKAAAEVRWTFKELTSFQAHATKWYNNLQGNWLYGDAPSDLPTLVQVVRGLVDWSDETTGMVETLRLKRKTFWEKHVMLPFELKHTASGMMYRFGCPSIMEESDGLRDAFNHANALLSSSAMPAPSVGGQAEDQLTLDPANATPVANPQNVVIDAPAITTAAPVAPAAPVVRVAPVAPVAPGAPGAPVSPVAAPTPVAPVVPIAPAAPVAPTVPVVPAALAVPVAPPAPVAPVAPPAPPALPAPVASAASAAPVAPITPVAHVAPAALVSPAAPAPPAAPIAPIAIMPATSTSPPVDPLPAGTGSTAKRKRVDTTLESEPRRTSSRFAAAPAVEPDMPRTRAAARATGPNGKAEAVAKKTGSNKGTSTNGGNGASKRTRK